MRLPLLSGLLTLAGFSIFAPATEAQVAAPPIAVPSATPGAYYYRNGFYYQRPTRANFAPVYQSPRSSNGAMTGRYSQHMDPTGRPVQLYKPWLRPLR